VTESAAGLGEELEDVFTRPCVRRTLAWARSKSFCFSSSAVGHGVRERLGDVVLGRSPSVSLMDVGEPWRAGDTGWPLDDRGDCLYNIRLINTSFAISLLLLPEMSPHPPLHKPGLSVPWLSQPHKVVVSRRLLLAKEKQMRR
jgi:hypothetical protein